MYQLDTASEWDSEATSTSFLHLVRDRDLAHCPLLCCDRTPYLCQQKFSGSTSEHGHSGVGGQLYKEDSIPIEGLSSNTPCVSW